MSAADAREQLALHLGRLADEGLWGLARPAGPGPDDQAAAAGDQAPRAGDQAAAAAAGELGRYLASPEPLAEIEREALACTRCALAQGRNKVVFGVGDPRARVLFIGEGPGREEDRKGEPFVGAAGQLLDRIIDAMGLSRNAVYIANTVKCRPPRNRNPLPDELAACRHFLLRQVAAIRPVVIVVLGRVAMQAVLGTEAPLGAMRGRFHDWHGLPVMCTYHPAYLLRNPADKGKTWEDIQQVMRFLAGEGT